MNLPFAEDLGCSAMWHVTWSLASEQQFYLVWPLLLCVLLVRRRSAVLGCLALGAIGLVWQVLLRAAGSTTARVDYAPDGRSLVLLLGCALALFAAHPWQPSTWTWLHRVRANGAAGARDAVAMAAVLALALCFATADLAAGMGALLPLVVTGVATALLVKVLAHAPEESVAAQLFGARPVAYLGRISYSLYLWHEVAYRMAELLGPRGSAVVETSRWVFAVLLAAASYAWVEVPAQRWWKNARREPVSA